MPGVLTAMRAELRLLTPLFMGSADPSVPELRAASLKAVLRHWYRAADPRAVLAERKGEPRWEDLHFGGAGDEHAGQSPVLLRVRPNGLRELRWGEINIDRFTEGQGKQARNGLRYLSYSLHLGGNKDRRALAPGGTFEMVLVVRPRGEKGLDARGRRAWLAALWLLGSLGSLGTRSRRGLGSVEITNWSSAALADDWRKDAAELPDLGQAQTPKAWSSGVSRGLDTLEKWFGRFDSKDYGGFCFRQPHLGPDMSLALLPTGFAGWDEALNVAGRKLQDFRVRRGPDYGAVKHALEDGQAPRQVPERAAFGLPLTFRYTSLPHGTGEAMFVPSPEGNKPRDRHASLLQIRLVRIGDRYFPLFVRMDGAVPGHDPVAEMVRIPGRHRASLQPAGGNLLDRFMAELAKG